MRARVFLAVILTGAALAACEQSMPVPGPAGKTWSCDYSADTWTCVGAPGAKPLHEVFPGDPYGWECFHDGLEAVRRDVWTCWTVRTEEDDPIELPI